VEEQARAAIWAAVPWGGRVGSMTTCSIWERFDPTASAVLPKEARGAALFACNAVRHQQFELWLSTSAQDSLLSHFPANGVRRRAAFAGI